MAMSWRRSGRTIATLIGLGMLASPAAHAQPEPPPEQPPARPAPPPPDAPPHAPPAGDAAEEGDDLSFFEKKLVEGDYPSLLEEALAPNPRGLTPDKVAARAAETSPAVAVSQAELRASAARVDQALAAYFPRASVTASYTRQSPVENNIGSGVDLPPGFEIPSFPVITNVWTLTASLEVPLTDYLTRLSQAYSAVSLDVEAQELRLEAQKRQAAADAQVVYFNWIRAKGQVAVSQLAYVQSDLHLADAKATFLAGLISEADVMRLEAQLAQAKHLSQAAIAFEKVAEQQLRTTLHLDPRVKLAIGVDVLGTVPAEETRPLPQLIALALKNRHDLKALRRMRASLEDAASATRGSYYPSVSAFANGLYGNPNPRIFPQENRWDFTWEVGVRMRWTINDTFITIGASNEAEARANAAEHQVNALEDAARLSVTQAYYDLQTARSAVAAADKREEAAAEALKVRRMLFRGGRATATDMVDAEAELTQARLARLDAHVDLLVARTRLDHAIGAH